MKPTMSTGSSAHPLWLLAGFWLCVFISLAVVARRIAELIRPSSGPTPGIEQFNQTFSSHVLTAAHIIPAAVFVILAVVVLLRAHNNGWVVGAFYLFGAITGVTAYAMSTYAIGGWVERSAVLVFDSWFLFALSRAYLYRNEGNARLERAWQTRAVGILLGIATTRPVMGVFFATRPATHLAPKQFFGIAFWIGFSINAAVIEFWLHSRRRRAAVETRT